MLENPGAIGRDGPWYDLLSNVGRPIRRAGSMARMTSHSDPIGLTDLLVAVVLGSRYGLIAPMPFQVLGCVAQLPVDLVGSRFESD